MSINVQKSSILLSSKLSNLVLFVSRRRCILTELGMMALQIHASVPRQISRRALEISPCFARQRVTPRLAQSRRYSLRVETLDSLVAQSLTFCVIFLLQRTTCEKTCVLPIQWSSSFFSYGDFLYCSLPGRVTITLVSSLSFGLVLSCCVRRLSGHPRVCHRVQNDSVANRQPFVVDVGVVMLCGRRVRVRVQLRKLTCLSVCHVCVANYRSI